MRAKDEVRKRKLFDIGLMRQMFVYLRPYLGIMVAAIVVSLLMVLVNSFLPVLIRQAIDDYMAPTASTLTLDARFDGLYHLALVYLLLAVLVFALRYLQTYAIAWMGQHVMYSVRRDLFDKALRLPFAFYDRNPVGRMMTRVTSDVESMQKAMTEGAVSVVADVLALFGIMGFMLYLNWRLALISFLVLPFVAVVITVVNHLIRKAERIVRRELSEMNAYLQERLTGMLTIQLFNREVDAQENFLVHSGRVRDARVKAVYYLSTFFPSIEILGAVSLVTVLGVGGFMMMKGYGSVSLGILVAFMAYMRELFRPLENLAERTNNLQTAMASGERVFDLMEEQVAIQDPDEPEEISSFRGAVDFDDVWFAYNHEEWVLKNISLHVAPGESIALVGATGSGKTTVASLLARFYDVQKGTVRLDGHDVRDLRLTDLRRRVGIVLQDPFVFSGTLLSNIGLHHPDLSREEIIQAARYVNADTFIQQLPRGYDTVVTERGVELSTGQKQLLALARALAQNPDILLILDEATANVDTETESLIQDALQKLMRGRTSIIIAHRLSTIQHVDRILVMRQGEIIEDGPHKDLLASDGYYKKLYDLLFQSAPAPGS